VGQVAVVTDTTQYMPPELAEANDITVVSLYVNFGGERTVREYEITDYEKFFAELRGADQWPTTSQPSVGDFIAAYEPLLAAGKDVCSVHISGGISGTADAARQAAQALERDGKGGERVLVYDSETVAGAMGLLVMAAARRAQAGDDLETVGAHVAAAREQLKMWFCVDTLEFLKRSGRIGGASAWIGSTLKIKPILTLEREMVPVERVRTSARAFERMVDYARQRMGSGADGWVVQHITDPEGAERLAERCREVFKTAPVFVSEVGPVLAAHAGPGMLGMGSIPKGLLA
jgi:DegV family protein with EDD domain